MNAFFLGLTLVLGAPEEKDTPTLNASIIGEWRVESVTANGRPRNDYVGTKYIFGWNGRWAKVIASDGKKPTTRIQLRYELVPADPFAIDLNPPGDFGSFGPRSVAIFKVEGDTLLICERSVRWGTEPPLKFEAPEGSKATLYVLKRVRPRPAPMEPTRVGLATVVGVPCLMIPPHYQGAGIVGELVMESANHGGQEYSNWPDKRFYRFTSDGRWSDGGSDCEVTCNPNAKPPTIDVLYLKQDNPAVIRQKMLGVYNVDGDTLTICFGPKGGDRPIDFEVPKDSGSKLIVLKRAKKKE